MKKFILSFVLLFSVAFISNGFVAQKVCDTITAEALQNILLSGDPIVLLDVRTYGEHAKNHLQGAYLIPINELPNRMNELNPNADIVVYCHSGTRSARACDLLRQSGYKKVRSLMGGMLSWDKVN